MRIASIEYVEIWDWGICGMVKIQGKSGLQKYFLVVERRREGKKMMQTRGNRDLWRGQRD